MNANLRRLSGWLICVPVAALGLTACGAELKAATGAPMTKSPSSTSATSATTTTKAHDAGDGNSADSGSGGSGGSGSGGSGSGGSGSGSGHSGGSGGGSSQPSAKVVSLTVVQQPSCPVHGTTDAPFSSPGNDVVISWKVSGVDGAAIGVDNPQTYGAYGSNYPKSGTESFAFGCGSDSGSTSHKFTVWPKDHPEISKTITVSARNNP